MLALRDPPEEHLVVCDRQEDWAPDGQKSPARSLIVPGFYQLGCEGDSSPKGGSAPSLAHGPRAVESGPLLGHGDTDNPAPAYREGLNNAPGPPCGGADGPQDAAAKEAEKKEQQEEQQEYSRVSGVRDKVVVLERDRPPLTPKDPKQRSGWGLLDSGYVDTVPSLP